MSEDESISAENLERDRTNQFWASLRKRVHEQQMIEIAERIRTNPQPTDEELAIGAFAEEIEPQARDAVLPSIEKDILPIHLDFILMGEFSKSMDGLRSIETLKAD